MWNPRKNQFKVRPKGHPLPVTVGYMSPFYCDWIRFPLVLVFPILLDFCASNQPKKCEVLYMSPIFLTFLIIAMLNQDSVFQSCKKPYVHTGLQTVCYLSLIHILFLLKNPNLYKVLILLIIIFTTFSAIIFTTLLNIPIYAILFFKKSGLRVGWES